MTTNFIDPNELIKDTFPPPGKEFVVEDVLDSHCVLSDGGGRVNESEFRLLSNPAFDKNNDLPYRTESQGQYQPSQKSSNKSRKSTVSMPGSQLNSMCEHE